QKQIDRAFRLSLGRPASDMEKQRLSVYVEEMKQYHAKSQPPKTTYPTKITRSLVEEFSGKPFQYTEILPVYERYEADTKPDEVSATTRALADLCLLLLNTNEFLYVE
ncbi:MAG: hypothetical protein KDA84_19145, partial [Planctomycetaceae bacterium]|nr:hypothetical protein [Planctomycetaceae bacterium]